MGRSVKDYALLGIVVAIVGIVIASYFSFASGLHIWPYSDSSGSAGNSVGLAANEVPAAYQATWTGRIGLPAFSVQLSLTLGSGEVNEAVGQISTSHGCVTAVILKDGGGPVTLSLDASNSPLVCHVLFEVFDHVTAALVSSDSLKFSVDVDGRSVSCYLHR